MTRLLIFLPGATTVVWTVTDEAGNTNTCSQIVTIETITGIVNVELSKSIQIYPNPASDRLVIHLPKSNERRMIKVYDINGKVILVELEVDNGETEINISDFKTGLYILKINSGEHTGLKRFVKK
jgi:hypothetical protein